MPSITRTLDGHKVKVTHPDKVLFPDDGASKLDLVRYHEAVAGAMLPYLRDRPLTLHRFTEGIGGSGFYQKRAGGYFPDWVRRVTVPSEDDTLEQVICDSAATLVYLTNQDTITLHPWLSRADRMEYPDQCVFDLDPPGDDPAAVRRAALLLRDLLLDLGLVPFVKSTGSRGFHVTVPLRRERPFDDVRAFCLGVAQVMAARHPEEMTTEVRKAARGGRLFVDYLRNAYAQTAVAPYSVRANPGAPVAVPLSWDELERDRVDPRRYTIRDTPRRLEERGDPWRGMARHARSLRKPSERLERLLEPVRRKKAA